MYDSVMNENFSYGVNQVAVQVFSEYVTYVDICKYGERNQS